MQANFSDRHHKFHWENGFLWSRDSCFGGVCVNIYIYIHKKNYQNTARTLHVKLWSEFTLLLQVHHGIPGSTCYPWHCRVTSWSNGVSSMDELLKAAHAARVLLQTKEDPVEGCLTFEVLKQNSGSNVLGQQAPGTLLTDGLTPLCMTQIHRSSEKGGT